MRIVFVLELARRLSENVSDEALQAFSTLTQSWSVTYQGFPLQKLELDSYTVSEVNLIVLVNFHFAFIRLLFRSSVYIFFLPLPARVTKIACGGFKVEGGIQSPMTPPPICACVGPTWCTSSLPFPCLTLPQVDDVTLHEKFS